MASNNDITGDPIKTKSVSNKYRDNYDKIFNKKEPNDKTKVALEEAGKIDNKFKELQGE